MKLQILLIFLVLTLSATAFSQEKLKTTAQPPGNPSLPMTPPIFGPSAKKADSPAAFSIASLPAIQTDSVSENVRKAMDVAREPKMGISEELRKKFDEADSNRQQIFAFRAKSLPKVLLWTLYGDAELIRHFSTTGNEKFAFAAFNHLATVANWANASDGARAANVTVTTVDSHGQSQGGFQICYLPSDWASLNINPLVFPDPSKSSETLPKTNWTFWSRDFQDPSKVGVQTPKNIDKDQTFSIGIPR